MRGFTVALLGWTVLAGGSLHGQPVSPAAAVGSLGTGRWMMPTGQILSPAGRQVSLPGVRPQAIALSPDGRILAIGSNANELLIADPSGRNPVRAVALPPEPAGARQPSIGVRFTTDLSPAKSDTLSVAGLVFSPDGTRIYFSNVNGTIKVFSVDGKDQVQALGAFPLPPAHAPARQAEIPAGLAVSKDGRRLYVAGALGNRLLELDAQTGRTLRTWNVGVAPFEVQLDGGRAYVTNQGGPRPAASDLTGPAGRGTVVRVDARSIADTGSVSVVDLASGALRPDIRVGLRPSALAVSPDGRHVVAANSGSDTLSVIATATNTVVETIWARQAPSDLFGAQPCALAFEPSGDRLYACNGTQNAVAVIDFAPQAAASRVIGLIPVGWFPAGLAYDRFRRQICVSNMKGIGSAREFPAGEPVKLNTKDYFGTLSFVARPTARELAAMTERARFDMSYPQLRTAALPARAGQPARPVPERTGEPSVFRHVVYIIKENRAYDQVLGDMKEGHGDASLCTFGETYTPNSHALSREFVLLDNTYCCGIRSADGHQWTDSGLASDYEERALTASSPRSYPDGKEAPDADALAYATSGFIWDNALAHHKTFRNYGEWLISDAGWADGTAKSQPQWADYWRDFTTGTHRTRLRSHAAIAALQPWSKTDTVGWNVNVPDVVRAAKFAEELKGFEAKGGFPDFVVIYLPNDHTSGTRRHNPTPGAQVADNDLALGRVVEALSHSRFWPETCVFAVEDDPQSGWDHVSGYRTTCYVASPFSRLHRTISTRYNQLSIVRTMELILGLPPMNQLDASAPGMSECFGDRADVTPYGARPNRVPLDTMNPEPAQIADPLLKQDAVASARLPLDRPDQCDEDTLNRTLWRAMKGSLAAYPAWAVTAAGADRDDD